ncbi:MAG: copper chaperone PCu(A)C [Gallionella sp.]|nr:copper chaperone PCu(A)C [Gallionella sp.]
MLKRLCGLMVLLFAQQAWAGANDVMVDKVWMRESVPGQQSVTVQMNLYVTKPARLLSVSSPVAASGEIQNVEKRHGKMQTSTVDSLKLIPNSTLIFGNRGIYLVLNGLKQALNVGDRVPVSLVIEMAGKKQTVDMEAEVKALELSYKHYNDPTVKDHR